MLISSYACQNIILLSIRYYLLHSSQVCTSHVRLYVKCTTFGNLCLDIQTSNFTCDLSADGTALAALPALQIPPAYLVLFQKVTTVKLRECQVAAPDMQN